MSVSQCFSGSEYAKIDLKEVILVGLLQRLLVFIACVALYHYDFLHIPLKAGDALAYLGNASNFLDRSFTDHNNGFFPGLSLLLACAQFFIPSQSIAAFLLAILTYIASLIVIDKVFGNRWVTYYWAICPPIWIFVSSLLMTEALTLTLCYLSIHCLVTKRNYLISGAVMSFALVVRPHVAVFVFGSELIYLLFSRGSNSIYTKGASKVKVLLKYVLITSIFPSLFFAFNIISFDSMLPYIKMQATANENAPGNLTFPFHGFIYAWLTQRYPLYSMIHRSLYWFFVTMGLSIVAYKGYLKKEITENVILMSCIALYLFNLCVSRYWAFPEFPRFSMFIYPFLIYSFSKYFPKNRKLLWLAAIPVALVVILSFRPHGAI